MAKIPTLRNSQFAHFLNWNDVGQTHLPTKDSFVEAQEFTREVPNNKTLWLSPYLPETKTSHWVEYCKERSGECLLNYTNFSEWVDTPGAIYELDKTLIPKIYQIKSKNDFKRFFRDYAKVYYKSKVVKDFGSDHITGRYKVNKIKDAPTEEIMELCSYLDLDLFDGVRDELYATIFGTGSGSNAKERLIQALGKVNKSRADKYIKALKFYRWIGPDSDKFQRSSKIVTDPVTKRLCFLVILYRICQKVESYLSYYPTQRDFHYDFDYNKLLAEGYYGIYFGCPGIGTKSQPFVFSGLTLELPYLMVDSLAVSSLCIWKWMFTEESPLLIS